MSELTSALDTAGEAAYRHIRHDIIFGGLAPSARLRLERLRETYQASVSTLREILNRLASERLVLAEGQRGFAVLERAARWSFAALEPRLRRSSR